MIPSVEAITKVLEKLVTPKFPLIKYYDVEIEEEIESHRVLVSVDVYFDVDDYWKTYHSGDYDAPYELDDEIDYDVEKATKYLGLNNVYTHVYIFT